MHCLFFCLSLLRQEFDIKLEDSERLAKRKNLDIKLDSEYINQHLDKLFDMCLERAPASSTSQSANRKSELALKILESLAFYANEIDQFDLVRPNIIVLLNKSYFDQVTKLFQSNADFVLKLVRMIIDILGKVIKKKNFLSKKILIFK